MSALVLYFTGTGNSLHAAEKIASRLEDAEVRSIVPLAKGEKVVLDAKTVVFVFPVYSMGFPNTFVRALQNISLAKDAFVTAVANCDSAAGAAIDLFNDEMERAIGRGLDAGWVVFMPGNYTPLYGAAKPEQDCEKLKRADEKLDEIGAAIARRQKNCLGENVVPLKVVSKIAWKLFSINSARCGNRFRASSDCTHCGICVRVCPVDNIVMDGAGRPKWLDKCEQCMACLQLCPVEAINCFWWTKGRRRYRHPDITVEKMQQQKNKWPVSR